ncbi:MAG: ABC transporter ATP-binding protein [SAR202 cluster bacterium]|nr:MAG: ABC transporter ATP-binding protein [SAR202 cluster bacterium]
MTTSQKLNISLSESNYDSSYITCRDLFKIYKPADLEVVALRGIDLDIKQGELTAIVGESGSGKSTFLNILAGLETPSAGQVSVGNRNLLDITNKSLVEYRRSEVGFVWQSTSRNLVPYLSVRDNIELPMAIAGSSATDRRKRSSYLLKELQIEDKATRLPSQLSGGEQQRTAIGVALSNTPPLLLADEPTGELDSQMAIEIFDLLRSINRDHGTTIVIVSHYQDIANHVNRVVHIRDGRISSESFMEHGFDRNDTRTEHEYVVIDEAGRLQIPSETLNHANIDRLAVIDVSNDTITLSEARRPNGKTNE